MYSPKIEPEHVRQLYLLKLAYARLGIIKPMTKITRDALDHYIPKAIDEILKAGGEFHLPDE